MPIAASRMPSEDTTPILRSSKRPAADTQPGKTYHTLQLMNCHNALRHYIREAQKGRLLHLPVSFTEFPTTTPLTCGLI